MSTLTVDQIQYNGGTAFTLPTGAPTAGQLLKTDGSGALGWVDGLAKVKSADGSSITYDKPPTPVANKILGTDGNENLTWVTGGGDPMKVGSHIGLRLADKVDFNSDISALDGTVTVSPMKAQAVYLRLPTSVSASNVSHYYWKCTGIKNNSSNWRMDIQPINTSNSSIMVNNFYNSYKGANYAQNNQFNSVATDYMRMNYSQQMSVGCADTTNGDFNNLYNDNIGMRGMFCEGWYYNAKYSPDAYTKSVYFYDANNYKAAVQLGVHVQQNGGTNVQLTNDHASGFKFYMNSNNFNEGMIELYYVLNDGA